jgi:PAS domain S-box-containing protein
MFFEPSYFLPLTAAVVACSWFFGRDGGIHATVVGALLADFVLMKPRYTFAFTKRTEFFGLLLFVIVGLLITWLTSLLRESQDLQTSILEGMSDALVFTDSRGSIVYINPAAAALTGFSAEEAKGRQFEQVFLLREEGTDENRSGQIAQLLTGEAAAQAGTATILSSKDGTQYSVEEDAAPIRGRDGRISGVIAVLRNTTRRRQMQDQLTQSQKMEAIGRLAGGVAGDFNNLLTVITGFGELLTSEMAAGNPLRHFAEEILVAADRAAILTRHLLAFGKGQSVPAKPHDLNTLVGNMEAMLGRVLGPTVELVILRSSRVCRVKTEPGQLEQVMVNLAMNARDAMPNGGKFVIEISDPEVRPDTPGRLPDLVPGSYVMLAVSDNGVGMNSETRARLFEPFFTTKIQGQATGLGLSIVYGIVKQHGGHISVYSQLGSGTIFEIYFPKLKELAETSSEKRTGPRGSETILIADDEESVRKLVYTVLVQRGYRVLEAKDGKEALELFEKNHQRIDMVLTDIVMPKMTGYQLGEQIEKLDPAKKILFMSGYRDSQDSSGFDLSRPFIDKPFTPEVLLKQVRETLDSPGV